MQSGVCCLKRDLSLWGGMLRTYSVSSYTAQAGKELKIQSILDFIVTEF